MSTPRVSEGWSWGDAQRLAERGRTGAVAASMEAPWIAHASLQGHLQIASTAAPHRVLRKVKLPGKGPRCVPLAMHWAPDGNRLLAVNAGGFLAVLAANRDWSAVVPEFRDAYADVLSHLRKLQSDQSVYSPAIERLKATINTELNQDRADALPAMLTEYAEKYPRLGGLDAVREDLRQWAAETEIAPGAGAARRGGKWTVILASATDEERARSVRDQARLAGYGAELQPRRDSGRAQFDVLIRNLPDRDEAARLAAAVAKDLGLAGARPAN